MIKRTDTGMIRILELISLLGEATSDEIKRFSNSSMYAEKLITAMKKIAYIKAFKNEKKSTLRLTKKGKKYLADNLPEIFGESFLGEKFMNRVRDDTRREERRAKLAEILYLFYRADVKIFPDEKQLLKNTTVNTRADTADYADKNSLEFYTSVEIKNIIPDYKKGIGSRALGILIAFGKIYIVYSTVEGNLLWRKDTEKDFLLNTQNVLARQLFGRDQGTYLLVIGGHEKVPAFIMKRKEKPTGKIYPCTELPNMIFALKDKKRDLTLDFILTGSDIPDRLESVFKETFVYDKKYLQYDGVMKKKEKDAQGNIITRETFGICAYRFNLGKIMDGIVDGAVRCGKKVMIFCFDFQRIYIENFLKELNQEANPNIKIVSKSIETYKEEYSL